MATYARKLKDASGNYVCPVTRAEQVYFSDNSTLDKIVSKIYPVGAIYMSEKNTSPASLFGGSWSQIQERFLYAAAASGTYAVGNVGGERTHTLIPSELPPVRMKVGVHAGGYVGENGTVNSFIRNGSTYGTESSRKTGDTSDRTPELYVNSSLLNSFECLNHPHNNMPPYVCMYMWKRVS